MTASQLSDSIVGILDGVQSSVANRPKLLITFRTLYEKTGDIAGFFNAFFPPFSNVLLVYKREPAVERVVSFVTSFAIKTAQKEKEGSDDEGGSESDEEIDESFFSLLIDKLLTLHQAKDKAVRFRVCQLLAKLLKDSVDSYTIGSDRLHRIQQAMMLRLYDRISVVRVHAVAALEFFQDADPRCPVVSAFIELMAKDSSPDVRRCILNKIATTNRSLEAVIERTRDCKEAIRHDAFTWLATRCSIRNFTIDKRIQLLHDGLKDQSEVVVKGCVNGLLRHWILECQEGDFITFLTRLDVESAPDVAELALFKLFDNLPLEVLVNSMTDLIAASNTKPEMYGIQTTPSSAEARITVTPSKVSPTPQETNPCVQDPAPEVKTLSHEFMKCEEVFYWSTLCRYLRKKGPQGEEMLERLLPTLSEFCDYVQSYVEEVLLVKKELESRMQCQFVAQQLCSMLAVLDYSDEVGRCRLSKLVCSLLLLPQFPTALIGPLLLLQNHIWLQDDIRISKLVEVIAELRQPSMLNPGCGHDTGPTNFLSEESQISCNLSLLDHQDDPDTLLRCLVITCELLKGLKIRKLESPTLLTLVDSLLIPCIQNENPYVRDMALHCLGLACILDLSFARNHILLFLQVSQVDHESVQATALKVVFDLFHIYGFEAFDVTSATTEDRDITKTQESKIPSEELMVDQGKEEDEKESEEDLDQSEGVIITQKILNIMATFLDGESMLLREVASEGICKLLLSHRISSQKLLAKLLLLWYNPITKEETELRSVLGLFFLSFASLDRDSRLCLSEVYLPVTRMILEAPPSSPIANIAINNFSDFILQLTQPPHPREESVHDSLAISVCNEVLSDPLSSGTRVHCRALSFMTLTPSNKNNAADLLVFCEQMHLEVTDKTSLRYLNKFRGVLKKISPDPTEPDQVHEPETKESYKTKVSNETTVQETTTPFNHVKAPPTEISNTASTKTTVTIRAISKKTQPTTRTKNVTRKGRSQVMTWNQQVSSTDDESDNENIEPEDIVALPRRIPLPRSTKRMHVDTKITSNSEESDDSVVGEHSPFVKHGSRKRQSLKPIQALRYSDDDDCT